MKHWIAGHRALLGLIGLAAWIGLFASLALPGVSTAAEIALLLLALAGLGALVGSPYWRIVYRESPLRRAATGVTDLDERELELRDRAHGLTYFLFATINILLLALGWTLLHINRASLGADMLQAAIIPYGTFAAALPVVLIEWFEPSGPAPAELDEEEEEA